LRHAALKGIAVNSLFEICNQQIRVAGRWVRIASLDADKYMFLDDPSTAIEHLKRSKNKVDLFTFLQRVSEPEPKYTYHGMGQYGRGLDRLLRRLVEQTDRI
jgi:hypothetical protein